jgi:hypothetical protein
MAMPDVPELRMAFGGNRAVYWTERGLLVAGQGLRGAFYDPAIAQPPSGSMLARQVILISSTNAHVAAIHWRR